MSSLVIYTLYLEIRIKDDIQDAELDEEGQGYDSFIF